MSGGPGTSYTGDDLRAAVAAGIVTEEQAARLQVLAQSRAGYRINMRPDEEPFELFRGFSEIFISLGLIILTTGISSLAGIFTTNFVVVPILSTLLAIALAYYFSLKRRMVLPSIVLTIGFFMAFGTSLALLMFGGLEIVPGRNQVILAGVIMIAALLVWFRVFAIPFTMALVGVSGLITLQMAISPLAPLVVANDWSLMFDLSAGSRLAFGMFIFGIVAFAFAMWFDMRDPYRLGRLSSTGFWLHVLAAPALVNTVALTFLSMENMTGNLLLALSLLIITLIALIIDRRSFITAGLAYMALLVGMLLGDATDDASGGGVFLSGSLLLVIMGAFVTLTGAFWSTWRSVLLRALPNFPGKTRLPPY